MCASHGARTKPKGAMKVKVRSGWTQVGPGAPSEAPAHCRPVSTAQRGRGGAGAYTLGPERW